MKTSYLALAVFGLGAVSAQAGGLDRSGQPIGIIFEQGNVVEFSLGYTRPSVDGVDVATVPISNVADNFLVAGTGIKFDVTDKFSLGVIVDNPYGSDVIYPAASPVLGGTSAIADSFAITAVGRYKINDRFSVHGGLRYQEISATVALGGAAYGGLNGYNVNFASDGATGFLIGAAYEIPDIALRVALTYNSEITHDLPTQEFIGAAPVAAPGVTEVVAPESVNLSFQSGIAEDTLLFGSIRYAMYEDTIVSPAFFDAAVDPGTPGSSLTDLDNSTDLEIGIGRRFNDQWSGSVALGYQSSGDDNLVSPLAPTNGSRYISVGARYVLNDAMTISGGIRYTDLGDAQPETGTPDTARASFTDNSAVSLGLRVQYKF